MKEIIEKQREYTIHKLKTWTKFFNPILDGTKTFELRLNDRDFKVGDRLDLMEYNPDTNTYTGSHCHRFISYILSDNPFIDLKGHAILGLASLQGEQEREEEDDNPYHLSGDELKRTEESRKRE